MLLKTIVASYLTGAWDKIKDTVVAPMPPEYMDDMNYGVFADVVARQTGMHPCVALALYTQISPHVTDEDSIYDVCDKISIRRQALSEEDVVSITTGAGLDGNPLSLKTKASAQEVMNTLPPQLQHLNRFNEYVLPQVEVLIA